MEYKHLLYCQEGNIGIVTINRPESLNALNGQVYDEIYNVFQSIADDPTVRAVILTGAGEKAFAAGGDITELSLHDSITIRRFLERARRASDRIWTLGKPVIAAVNGYALGGGCELAMCCDFIVTSEKARFGLPEINLGIIPGAGGTQRLSRLIGISRSKWLVYSGEQIDATTALAMGLVARVVPHENVMAEAKEMAIKLLSKSGVALAMAKQSINGSVDVGLPAGLDIETHCISACFASEDHEEGMNAFIQKRKPEFKNR